ncbi:hypothetical protein JR316_0002816 [Psilocybe cubensis]|uniref:Uncharacterized protein n=1 Tax=Psilocybe cubensis TaxID=181762 RepID=A0ACB8HFE9_PSICU|nr:hypothetical protein JR316_0002816 [Psilocybe cubensis]KAH9485899.1 hypothetical protein JR316_0002816 [Psilocybe cubensis]
MANIRLQERRRLYLLIPSSARGPHAALKIGAQRILFSSNCANSVRLPTHPVLAGEPLPTTRQGRDPAPDPTPSSASPPAASSRPPPAGTNTNTNTRTGTNTNTRTPAPSTQPTPTAGGITRSTPRGTGTSAPGSTTPAPDASASASDGTPVSESDGSIGASTTTQPLSFSLTTIESLSGSTTVLVVQTLPASSGSGTDGGGATSGGGRTKESTVAAGVGELVGVGMIVFFGVGWGL